MFSRFKMAPLHTPFGYCQHKVKRSASSFYYSFLFLPKAQYQAIVPLYAFCREIDDIVDEGGEPAVISQKLRFFAEELELIYANQQPSHPITRALFPVVQQYQLPLEPFQNLMWGMWMDREPLQIRDIAQLNHYTHCVAGTVGILVSTILGYQNPKTLEYADTLGMALQLINIIRDVGEDTKRGRCYLPLSLREEEGLEEAQLQKPWVAQLPAFKRCLAALADRARMLHRNALSHLAPEDRKTQRAGLMMGALYLKLLDKIEAKRFEVIDERIRLTAIEKMQVAFQTYRSCQSDHIS